MKQRSAAWHKARLGIPTASSFDKILSPKALKSSTQAKAYRMQLLAEWITGVPKDTASSGFMERGTMLELEALRWYEMEHNVDVEQVGLVLRDDRMCACSPDGLVGKDGGLEIKCPSAATHVDYLLSGLDDYHGQVQGAMWLSGRAWWDLLSYCPGMPAVSVRFERSEAYAEAIEREMDGFLRLLKVEREHLIRLGCKPAARVVLLAGQDSEDPF